ncbi:uncharacterized protein LOC117780741 isoform X2 [Drosophila innubila]|uniref:uncharacterized protein LOC117780741 isoform X2 n=1 Tax=Drosophila innubila TaxID=198719 RepID=UPI00148D9EEF|nr:uncharacterized protein LOC117780741 isoform X2 [Drosophila innubila]
MSTKIVWNQDSKNMLIEVYEQHPNLYDPKNPQYRNKHYRDESLKAILEQLRTIYDNIDIADIKTKIGTMRSQYLLHLKKQASCNSNSKMRTDEKGKHFCLDNLEFLKPYMKINEKITSNFDIHNDSVTSDSADFIKEEPLLETSSCSSRIVEESAPSAESILKIAIDELCEIRQTKSKFQPDVDSFGELVKWEMERIGDPKKRMEIRLKILQTFYDNY